LTDGKNIAVSQPVRKPKPDAFERWLLAGYVNDFEGPSSGKRNISAITHGGR
jgi:hypothetical protein